MKKTLQKIVLLFCLFCISKDLFAENDLKTQEAFIDSFVRYYDFTTVGRYTHEYHPFLFEKSSHSLDELEKSVEDNGMMIKGRVVIAGYEEAAVPAYYTNYKICTGSKINDEVRIRDAAGWTQQLHNKFGVMTGYLFRDVPTIAEYCRKKGREPLFEHINLHTMPIYDRDSWLFQRHAFGKMFGVMENNQTAISLSMCRGDSKKLFSQLINFWRTLYESELKFGNRQVLGTQDVLFSIAHAQHLHRSSVPLFKYYAGPDITYPIKVTTVQKESATYNAQTFVKKFSEHIKPIEDKPTVYIFCSFVDGVGKSTLLGNVQNYKKYGNRFKEYDPVDNSSSQLAQMYKCEENVFIADLPAQMSHFTYKPDGMVYFDPLAAGVSQDEYGDVVEFAVKNKDSLVKAHNRMVAQVKKTVAEKGWFARSICDPKDPQRAFAKNLLLMKRSEKNLWIPFEYKNNQYLFYLNDPERIRMLVKLELADSIGLKNYEAEQMLFLEGVRFPLSYHLFLKDFVDKLKKRNIKNVVFVDFLSMYPRSSRENIRINYLLQQLSLLYKDFSIEESSYGTFVNDAQLFHKLKNDKKKRVLDSFKKESLLRLSLYNVMKACECYSIDGVKLNNMTKLLAQQLQIMPSQLRERTAKMAKEKLDREVVLLGRVHGKTKNYVNIQELSLKDVLELGQELQKFFERHVKRGRFGELWKKLDGELVSTSKMSDGPIGKQVTLSNGEAAELLYIFSPECKNAMILAPVLRHLRASWYCALVNIVGGKSLGGSKNIKVEEERYFVPPVWMKKTKDGRLALLRRVFDRCYQPTGGFNKHDVKEGTKRTEKIVNYPEHTNRVNPEWGLFKKEAYLLNADRARTDKKLFAFGYDPFDYASSRSRDWSAPSDSNVSYFVQEYKEKEKGEVVMPAETLWKKFENDYWWKRRFKNIVERAKKNDKAKNKTKKKKESKHLNANNGTSKKVEIVEKDRKRSKQRIMIGKAEQKSICQFAVCAFATIEMLAKDVNSDIAVRRKNKKDFVSALKLFEKIVLPTYLDVVFENNLFDDYRSVKPLVDIALK